LTSAAVAPEIDNGSIRNVRIAVGGVGTNLWRALEAEQELIGKKANEENYRAAASIAVKNAKTHQYNAFKPELSKRTIIQALQNIGG